MTNRQYNVDPFEGDNDREPELIDAQEAIHKLIEHTHSPHCRPSEFILDESSCPTQIQVVQKKKL